MKKTLTIPVLVFFVITLIPISNIQASTYTTSAYLAECTDKASFVSDVTIPDGTRIDPGKSFEKVWRLKNTGTCTWSTAYSLVFVSGQKMGGLDSMTLPVSVQPGGTVDLKVTLTAPSVSGSYRSNYMLRNAEGLRFGLGSKADQLFWVQIVAGKANSTSVSGAGSWKGEYFTNTDLYGKPKLVRTDSKIDFNWKGSAPASGIPSDNFSVRWTQTLEFSTGIYRFRLIADDKATLRVGDRMVLRTSSSGSEQTYDLAVVQGRHKVVVEYREFTGNARVKLTWEKLSSPSFSDWKGEYWNNANLSGSPIIVRNDKAISFRWNEKAPVIGMVKDSFSSRWTRTVKFADATYRFSAIADDGIRVYIDGKRVLNEWHVGNAKTIYTFDKRISGNHTIVVEFYDGSGNAKVRFWWEPVTTPPAPTPTTTPAPTPTPTPTPTQTSTVLYSFAEQTCGAEWKNATVSLPCPGTEGDVAGYVLRLENNALEKDTLQTGLLETSSTILTHPEAIENGIIMGVFPVILVQAGDHFQSTIGCRNEALACNVIFKLNYRVGDGEIQTLASWPEIYDGKTTAVDVDLTPLAGNSVQFVLTVLANGQPTQDQALWVFPKIMR